MSEQNDTSISLSQLCGFSERQNMADKAVKLFKYVLYGGAVGGGKSYFIRWKMVKMLIHWYNKYGLKSIEVGIFCEDYPTLKDRQLGKILKEFPEWLGTLHDDHKAHGKCYILEPEYGGGIIKFRNLDDPSKYQCFRPGTEILTQSGWKHVDEVSIGEQTASLNLQSNKVEFHPVTRTWSYDFDGHLIETPANKSLISFSVTENHKIPARTRRKKTYTLTEAQDLPREFYIPTNGEWSGVERETFTIPKAVLHREKKPVTFDMYDWMYFMGWYLSEGSLDKGRYAITISQNRGPNHTKIENCIRRLGFVPYVDDKSVRFNSKSLYEYLHQFGLCTDKFIPREFLELHPKYLKALLSSLLLGDGHVYKNGYARYVTTSKQLADDVMELSLRLGYTPSLLRPNHVKGRYQNAKTIYHVGIRNRSEGKIDRNNLVRTQYKGKVHCVTVEPHHTIFIRYRDRVSVSGQSAEFAAIAVDELTKNVKETFLDLKHRLRWPGIEDTRFFAGTNPGGVGHSWVKKLWMDKDFEPEEQDEADQYYYVPALAMDNPHLPESYLKQLDTLPDEMRRALRDGDWDLFKGQFFGEWRRVVHTTKAFTIPAEWTRFICGDYGYAAPSAVYWCAVSPDNVLYVYRELYKTGLTYEQLAKEIISMTPDDEKISFWVFDPAIWAKSGASSLALSGAEIIEQTYAKIMKDSGKSRFLRLMKGDNNRVIGWGMVRERLKPRLCGDGETRAGVQVFAVECPNLIRTMPALIYDKNNIEDCDCFVAGTPVLTDKGYVPVETVKVGDMMVTPIGNRPVIKAGISGTDDTVVTVTTEDGRTLRGTADHEVYVVGKGLVELQNVQSEDILMEKIIINPLVWNINKLSIKGLHILGDFREIIMNRMVHILRRNTPRFIVRYISTILDQFLTVGRFIIKMGMSTITIQATLRPSHNLNTCGCTIMKERINFENNNLNGSTQVLGSYKSEQMLKKCEKTPRSGEHRAEIVSLLLKRDILQRFFVKNANTLKDFIQKLAKFVGLNFYKKRTELELHKPARISAVGSYGKEKVYRLTVADAHLFFANGFLVTNTDGDDHGPDAFRYGCMANPQRSRTREEEDDIAFRKKIKENRRKASLSHRR